MINLVRTPKHHRPNPKALPPLLDEEKEAERLSSISQEMAIEKDDEEKRKKLERNLGE